MLTNLNTACLAIVCLTLPILTLANVQYFFDWRFNYYHVYKGFPTGEASAAPSQVTTILNYIRPPFTQALDQTFFSTEDILHMEDVRNIFVVLYVVFGICSSIIIFNLFKTKQLWIKSVNKLLKVWGIIMAVITLLAGAFLLNWQAMFVLFHQVFFPFNNYWSLDPSSSNLIKYFLPAIFQEAAALIYLAYAGIFFALLLFRSWAIISLSQKD
jgi:integral membrane protein (TIGR01906 family)